ncbi:GNAT family N-acetyltransferase [Pseudonocardia ammonioxydans]|uniref:GNAT family N-acetyltransferase n=1 Tax=Pseudonocardia ammonioxydans TaxID=260086 RepID=UPI001FE7E221|nr:GNAT family N-acetyltransferase [Pseudonocardia ammonioxydans]
MTSSDDPLDAVLRNPVPAALTGPQRAFGAVRGAAARFHPEVCPFAGLPLDPTGDDWADLAALCDPGSEVVVVRAGDVPPVLPAGWELVQRFAGVQMDGAAVPGEPDVDAVELGPADHAAMAELTGRTRPGPWLDRTAELGRYVGFRHDGRLIAMAGERMRIGPDGGGAAATGGVTGGVTEISAVCTDPEFRGKGLARRLVNVVAAGIVARGERPVLHASAANEGAIRLYRAMGFTLTRAMRFDLLRTPTV